MSKMLKSTKSKNPWGDPTVKMAKNPPGTRQYEEVAAGPAAPGSTTTRQRNVMASTGIVKKLPSPFC